MFNSLRNAYATALFSEWLESTEVLIFMAVFVILAGCVTWIIVRGIYGHKIAKLRYILFWMILTQLITISILDPLHVSLQQYDEFIASAIRIVLWVIIGLFVSLTPLIGDALHLSLRARIGYLFGVHIVMRFLIFATLGGAFFYGLYYPKMLSKITRVAPACREAVVTVLQDL